MKKKTRVPMAAAAAPLKASSPPRSWLWHGVCCLVLLLMVGVAYRNSFQSGWVLDNKTVIQLDPRNKEATLENLKLIWEKDYWWPTMYTRAYRPLVSTTYWLNWSVFGNGKQARESDQVVGFHWLNLIAHWINAVLVYVLMLKLLKRRTISFLIGALFALHPIATESVTNIIGRTDEFLAMSILGCTLLYIRSTEASGLRRAFWLLGVMLVYFAGLLSKESATAFLAVPFLYDAIFRWGSEVYRERKSRRILQDCLVYVTLALPLFATLYLRSRVFRHTPLPAFPFLDNPILRFAWSDANSLQVNIGNWVLGRMTAFNIALKGLWKLLWPVHLSSDYSYNHIKLFSWQLTNIENLKAILGLVLVAGTLVAAAWCYRRHKAVCFFILFYWVALGPTANFLATSSSIFAERFLYVPSVAFCALMVLGAEGVVRRVGSTLELNQDTLRRPWPRLLPHAAFLVVLTLYGFRTYNRNIDWRSDITLSQSAIKEAPDSFRGYFGLARAYHELDRAGRIDSVIELGEKGLKMVDHLPDVENSSLMYLHQGMYYGMKGETVATRSAEGFLTMNEQTQQWYRKSVQVLERGVEIDRALNEAALGRLRKRGTVDPPDTGATDVYKYLGMGYERLGLDEKGLAAYKYMRHLDPTQVEPYVSIAFGRYALRRENDAAIAFVQCVILDPNRQQAWQGLMEIYEQIDKESIPAVEVSDGRARFREDNKLAQQHLLAAYQDLIRTARAAGRPEMVQAMRDSAVNVHRLSPTLLDEALQENVARPVPPSPAFHAPGTKLFQD